MFYFLYPKQKFFFVSISKKRLPFCMVESSGLVSVDKPTNSFEELLDFSPTFIKEIILLPQWKY